MERWLPEEFERTDIPEKYSSFGEENQRPAYLDSPGRFSYFFEAVLRYHSAVHNDVLSLVLAGLSGYLLGSIPTAFLLVQWFSNVDIRQTGSGNVGTLNSYLVTRSKAVGAAVLLVDLLKGLGSVVLVRVLVNDGFAASAAGAAGAVLGHNFPVWLRFKGGRGLAAGAGAMLALAPLVVVLWCILWLAGFLVLRRVNVANALATVVAGLLLLLAPGEVLGTLIAQKAPAWGYKVFVAVFFGIILIRHRQPVQEFFRARREKKEG